MQLFLVPLMGPLHLRFPLYNAVSVRDAVAALEPDALALTPLEPGTLDTPAWQDTPEVALPLAVVPWAKKRGLPLYPVLEPSPDPNAERDFRRYAAQYTEARNLLSEVDAALRPLQFLLEESLSLKRIQNEVLPLLRHYQTLREARLGDGPGTDWLRERMERVAARVLELPHERVAVLASADHVPFLEDALVGQAELIPPPEPAPSDEARERSLLDFAFRGDPPEPGNVIAKLRTLAPSEARYHEANLLLAHGHLAEALAVLEEASHGDFSKPYYLPGYLLSRLGQLRDLAGERAGALRAYRGALALDWAPGEARAAAEAGLKQPFEAFEETAP